MNVDLNEHGVRQFSKGDARRLFVLLAAIEKLERPTLTSLSAYTGHNKGTIDADVRRLCEQFGLKIDRDDQDKAAFVIRDWGDLLKRSGVRKFLLGKI